MNPAWWETPLIAGLLETLPPSRFERSHQPSRLMVGTAVRGELLRPYSKPVYQDASLRQPDSRIGSGSEPLPTDLGGADENGCEILRRVRCLAVEGLQVAQDTRSGPWILGEEDFRHTSAEAAGIASDRLRSHSGICTDRARRAAYAALLLGAP